MSIESATLLIKVGGVPFLVMPIFILFFKGVSLKPLQVLTKYLVCVVFMYLVVAASLYNLNYQLDLIVVQLDRDGDGSISLVEESTWTEEEIKARKMRVADGGRNVVGYLLTPYLAAAYSAVVFLFSYLCIWFFKKIKVRFYA
ncbi:hypothetical protein [Pseudoalteromonas sp. R3]|uniref:hypothetical protein n=1 Tax=Pseudoalteromonas sp. R3 TaxID=1709477 RepID=UPI0006B486A8|nr:hypothetical protein [Pseudoalteromonas sp. R3]AZZ98324.1 hypothetical protein ELR70_15100 [Pseudoalteromonas sp. R3]